MASEATDAAVGCGSRGTRNASAVTPQQCRLPYGRELAFSRQSAHRLSFRSQNRVKWRKRHLTNSGSLKFAEGQKTEVIELHS